MARSWTGAATAEPPRVEVRYVRGVPAVVALHAQVAVYAFGCLWEAVRYPRRPWP